MSAGTTSNFNHPCQDYVNYQYILINLSAQMTSTQNDGKTVIAVISEFRSWIKLQILFQHKYNFLLPILP